MSSLAGSFQQFRTRVWSNVSAVLIRNRPIVHCSTRSFAAGWHRRRESRVGLSTEATKSTAGIVRPILRRHNDNNQGTASNVKIDRPAALLVFDVETTGYLQPQHKIIEIAVRDLAGGENSTFESLVNPGISIRNSHVHGITTAMVRRPGVPRFDEMLPVLVEFIESRRLPGKPIILIAHNGRSFDVPFLAKEFRDCGAAIPSHYRFLDSLPLSRMLSNPDGSKLRSCALNGVREHYNVESPGPAHRAMQDAIVLSILIPMITSDLNLTLPELLSMSFAASDVKVPLPKTCRD